MKKQNSTGIGLEDCAGCESEVYEAKKYIEAGYDVGFEFSEDGHCYFFAYNNGRSGIEQTKKRNAKGYFFTYKNGRWVAG